MAGTGITVDAGGLEPMLKRVGEHLALSADEGFDARKAPGDGP